MTKYLVVLTLVFVSACTSSRHWPVDYSDSASPCLEVNYVEKSFDLKSKKDYRTALYSEGMHTVWKYFEAYMRPEVRMNLSRVSDSSIKVGKTKVGGSPDLPEQMNWPTNAQSDSLSFLAQINLGEVRRFKPVVDYLPEEGILYFFYSTESKDCRYQPSPESCFRVFYANKTSALKKKETSSVKHIGNKYSSCQVGFEKAYSLPSWNYGYIKEYASEAEDCAYEAGSFMEAYMDIRGALNGDRTKMFGNADEIQGEFSSKNEDWLLLFQLSSESAARMEWNDSGLIYFWIKKTDLAQLDFSNMEIEIQGH